MADLNQQISKLTDTPDTTADFDPVDVTGNKVMAILAYISWLVLIPLIFANQSKFARFHSNQGLLLAIVEVAASIVLGALSGIPLIGWLFSIIGSLVDLCCFVFSVLGIVNAVNGKAKELPFIGGIHLVG